MATYAHDDDDITPEMTADDAPSPNVTSASTSASALFSAWHAFCHNVIETGGTFLTAYGNPTGWLKFDFGAGNTHIVDKYTLSFCEGTSYSRAPKTWTLQGSNNDSDWDILDTQTDVAAWASSEMRTYSFVSSTAYRYYKLNVTANQGDNNYLMIGELELFVPQSINADITLPMATAEGYTGIDARDVTNPSMISEGFTGIYSAPSIPMAAAEGFTGIYSAPSFPMIRANGTLSDNMVHVTSSVTIPSMTAAITQAKQIWGAVTVPMMRASLTERETVLGNAKIPMMTASLSSGLHANVSATVPMMTAAGLFGGRCAVTVPMMTAALTGKVGRVGNISVKLPMMTVSITGKTEHLGNISVTVPMMLALAELITGKVITGAATIPMMTAALSSYEDFLTGDINVSIPMMIPYLSGTTERATCPVLRYEDTYDCIGKIEVDLPMITASIEGS